MPASVKPVLTEGLPHPPTPYLPDTPPSFLALILASLDRQTRVEAGTGVPDSSFGRDGWFWFRTDTPGTVGQRLYVKSGGAWSAIDVAAPPPFATPNIGLDVAAADGVANSVIRSDAVIVAFDATLPSISAVGNTGITGTATVASRRDHRHPREGFGGVPAAVAIAGATGAASTLPRSDHVHPAYASPACRAYNNANLNINNATYTVLGLNSERYDTDGIHDTVTNNSRLTAKTAGKYIITGHVAFAANVTGHRYVDILLNGATTLASHLQMAVTTAGFTTDLSIATEYQLAVNDYVELRVYQNSGGALNVLNNPNNTPELAMAWVAP